MFKDPILKPKLVMKDVGFVKCGSEFIVIQKSKKKKKVLLFIYYNYYFFVKDDNSILIFGHFYDTFSFENFKSEENNIDLVSCGNNFIIVSKSKKYSKKISSKKK